jgi:hypothetical protein
MPEGVLAQLVHSLVEAQVDLRTPGFFLFLFCLKGLVEITDHLSPQAADTKYRVLTEFCKKKRFSRCSKTSPGFVDAQADFSDRTDGHPTQACR